MKSLNTVKFLANATLDLEAHKKRITGAPSFEAAKSAAYKMVGYLDCMTTMLNTMICTENNGLTAELDEFIDSELVEMFCLLEEKAKATHQDVAVVSSLTQRVKELRCA